MLHLHARGAARKDALIATLQVGSLMYVEPSAE